MLEFFHQYIEETRLTNNKTKINSLKITLSTLYNLLENCPNSIYNQLKIIAQILFNVNYLEQLNIDNNKIISLCLNSLLKNNKEIMNESYEHLINIFMSNFESDDYDLNFSSAEFFCFVSDKEENIISNTSILQSLENILPQ